MLHLSNPGLILAAQTFTLLKETDGILTKTFISAKFDIFSHVQNRGVIQLSIVLL